MKPKRCGSCTQCCKTMKVAAFDKPAGVWCAHCKVGIGCGVYEDRPEECREFACGWLRDPAMPHRMRPDLTKVVLYTDKDGARLVAYCDPANPLAWRREPVYSALKRWASRAFGTGGQVVAAVGNRVWLIAPNNEVDLGELDPDTPLRIEEMPNGTIEVRVGEPSETGLVYHRLLNARP